MSYPYGKDFDYYFYPLIDDEAVASIPSQQPDVYIFDDSVGMPSRTDAAAGTGAVQTISTWAAVQNGFKITVLALTDPDPTGNVNCRTYWIAINFLLKAGGQVQTVLRALDMERVVSQEKSVGVSPSDLTTMWPEIAAYASDTTLQAAIDLATEEVKSILLNRGYEWSSVMRPDRLALAIKTRALMQIESQQRQQAGDNFDRNYTDHKLQYKSYLDSLQIEYDANEDGKEDAKVEAAGFAVVCR